ncbi:MAG: pentapeptide repeat-containing protein [Symploca sp. SIO2C1]|nr:pentapeptide repeat-containing protein [Symploca sp. SIO2C1]
MKHFHRLLVLLLVIVFLLFPLSAQAATSSKVLRSERAKDLSGQDFSGQNLREREFSNVNLESSNFSNADLRGAVFKDSVINKANLHGANFTYGITHLVDLTGADLSDGIFVEAIMLRSTFDDVDITGADFTNAVLDGPQVQKLCTRASGVNSKTRVATSESLGCR